MSEQHDSQLSAMYDDELPAGECDLLARRLARDPQLKERWERYALIGAAMRAEPGAYLGARLAPRVTAALSNDAAHAGDADAPLGADVPDPSAQVPDARPGERRAARRAARPASPGWVQGLTGTALAAGIAMLAVGWLRGRTDLAAPPPVARSAAPAVERPLDTEAARAPRTAAAPGGGQLALARHSGPLDPSLRPRVTLVSNTELTNYLVAHSEVSSPMARRALLSSLVAGPGGSFGPDEPPPPGELQQELPEDARGAAN